MEKREKLYLGIFTGYFVVQIICALFVFGIGSFLPNALNIIKYLGAAYILWLAIHIIISKPDSNNSKENPSFFKGFVLQFINVKIYLFGITALTGFITDYHKELWVLIFLNY